jgi:parvulin-like peptidyl-prolyl isomerase
MDDIQNNSTNGSDYGVKTGIGKEKIIIFSIIIGVLLIAGGIFAFFYYQTNVAAVVTFDGGKVTVAEYTIYYKIFQPMLEYYGYDADQIPEQIANKAGVDKILLMKAKQAGVSQSDEKKAEVDKTFADKSQIESLTKQDIDPNQMKQLYYDDNIISAYIDKLKKDASNDDVLKYIKSKYGDSVDLNEYVTRQILFTTTDSTTKSKMTDDKIAEVKKKAQGVLDRIIAGEDFAKLVSEFSDDAATKANGGTYKMYMDSNTVETYVNAVKTLKAGQTYATLVESDYGFHIIKLEVINAGGRVNSDADRENLVNTNIDKYGEELHIKINADALNRTLKQITGKDSNIKIY